MKHRWFQFSIRSLLVVMLLCALGVHYWPWREKPSPHPYIRKILLSGASDEEKLKALSPYVSLGEKHDEITYRLGTCEEIEGHGPGFMECTFQESGLVLAFYPDGTAYGIGFYPPPGLNGISSLHWLEYPDVVTWPRPSN